MSIDLENGCSNPFCDFEIAANEENILSTPSFATGDENTFAGTDALESIRNELLHCSYCLDVPLYDGLSMSSEGIACSSIDISQTDIQSQNWAFYVDESSIVPDRLFSTYSWDRSTSSNAYIWGENEPNKPFDMEDGTSDFDLENCLGNDDLCSTEISAKKTEQWVVHNLLSGGVVASESSESWMDWTECEKHINQLLKEESRQVRRKAKLMKDNVEREKYILDKNVVRGENAKVRSRITNLNWNIPRQRHERKLRIRKYKNKKRHLIVKLKFNLWDMVRDCSVARICVPAHRP
ncbi:hypothetical protein F5884DRAFT_757682 [Xylogone sp. PMI_703]|nr:hypothetical protein F5884DRAFT_757682 [Xylogone sp. PMI_703]